MKINIDGWPDQIASAISKEYINEDFEADWDKTTPMQEVQSSLRDVDNFIEESSQNFDKQFKNAYKAPLRMSNSDFWQEVFNVSILI
ncbi:MAG: hypothetical protein ACLQMS_02505 [Desulfomonilaceae bacterium]